VSFKGRVHIIDQAGKLVSNTARLKNVSPSGFSLISEDKIKVGADYLFKIFLNIEETLEVKGTVLYMKTESIYLLAGVRLLSSGLGQRAQLNRFLASQSATIRMRFFIYAVLTGLTAALIAKICGASLPVVLLTGFGVMISSFLFQPW
jgi:hypothetical protein